MRKEKTNCLKENWQKTNPNKYMKQNTDDNTRINCLTVTLGIVSFIFWYLWTLYLVNIKNNVIHSMMAVISRSYLHRLLF